MDARQCEIGIASVLNMNSSLRSIKNILLLTTVTICLWIVAAAFLNDSQLGDSLEQFIWGQSLEWGYWKHPPVTSWLMYFFIHTFGSSPIWTYVLSAILYSVTVVATYKVAELLFDRDVAVLTAIFLTLHYGFTRRAQIYNHNTVLVAFVALTVLAVLYAIKKQKNIYWIGSGLLAGLSILVKYQAVLPFLGVLVAIALTGDFKKSVHGIVLALLVCLLTVTPHMVWLFSNDFKTVTYAVNYINGSEFSARSHRSVAFFVTQLRYFLPALFFMFLVWGADFVSASKQSPRTPIQLSTEQRAWLVGLIAVPLFTLIFIALGLGASIQSHWGLQTTQFLVIGLAVWLKHRFGVFDFQKVWIWLTVQLIAFVIFVGQGLGLFLYESTGMAVRELPAQKFSDTALSFWASKTNCPLKYLSGHASMAGMISGYARQTIQVLEDGDFAKSPWITAADLEKSGYLEVAVASGPSNDVDTFSLNYQLRSYQNPGAHENDHLILTFHKPANACP